MSAEWEKEWLASIADIPSLGSDIHYTKSADRLRKLMREGPYSLTDLRDEPERFFAAHRLLSRFATQLGPGFGIRFTVQVNLFAGSIIALGNPEQLQYLQEVQKKGLLGCFCLTERLAGVNSGLVVNTTATWDESKQMFLLDCPDEGSAKNWISQGLTADVAVVVATLIVKGKSKGPHAFVMKLRGDDGKLVEGVSTEDMGGKTIGNDLDNARIRFSKVWLAKSTLLDRYAGIENNEYVQKQAGVSNMDMIGQRLYTGRTVIAKSTLVFARTLYSTARKYADNKKCWHPKGPVPLSSIPQLSNLYVEADHELSRVETLCAAVEKELCECLRSSAIPSEKLVEKVAVLKVKAIETSISYCFRLKQELGSYALMAGTGFEKMDYLQCCKFAEGDSRILMQKIARDRLTAFSKKQEGSKPEVAACMSLGKKLMKGGKAAWSDNWQDVYALAGLVMERITQEACGKAAFASKL
eukprot:CAMPEP_0206487252 /NCGR_PEP_ID=MMETSP0324_2-20121206/41512_1 /ASSEMBLY_ACC=CAM_ASM_000836 /TAXON_ID=2866 /ORGANISM="Crypthecodinium cohnii, Strain Seligo" /LENGTH=468 /DNA_ID=CAMNT_0053965661 /DNA_START=203 /DNA_END=1609 /DNA_ORIENTATION=-